jgi:hypothetical protein
MSTLDDLIEGVKRKASLGDFGELRELRGEDKDLLE